MRKDFSDKTPEECDKAALARVYRSLAASEQSSKKLRSKMEAEGYPSASIEFALDRAVQIGVLSDSRYCDMLVRNTLASGKGMQRCLREIEGLGIDPMELESYAEYIEGDEDTETDRALEFLKSHRSKAKDVRGSAFRKLISKGYSFEIASRASSEYMDFLKNEDAD